MADQNAVLHHFDGRGRAEVVRMMLCAAGIKFDSVEMQSREQFLKLINDGELVFKVLPMLKIDGLKICQTNAIVRYLARRAGMEGKTQREQAEVDMFFEGTRDCYQPFLGIGFFHTGEKTKAELEKSITKFFPIFDKRLGEVGTGYLVGSSMTMADIGLLEVLLATVDYVPEKIDTFPNIKKFLTAIRENDRVANYIKNVRKRTIDDAYISHAKAVLNW